MKYDIDNIYLGDALAMMKELPDDCVDSVVTSPPYNFCLRIHGGKYTHRSAGEKLHQLAVNKYTNGLRDSLPMDEYFNWQCECIDQMLRLSKGPVFYNIQPITGNKVAVFKIIGKYAEHIREVLIWDKTTAEPAMSKNVLNSEYEFIIVFEKGDCKGRMFNVFNAERGTLSNVIRIGKNRANGHRAAFPVNLPRHLLKNFTPPARLFSTHSWAAERLRLPA